MSTAPADRSRRRRALLLGGLALVLGGVAASDMAGREQELDRRLGDPVPVLVSRNAVAAGDALRPADLAIRRVPARYAPRAALRSPSEVAGLRAATAIAPGSEILTGMVEDGTTPSAGAPVRRGERIAEVVAAGSADLVQPGTRADVLVTQEAREGAPGGTVLALQDVEVLAATPVAGDGREGAPAGAQVAASLRVTLRQAVYLAAAQSFAREIRLLPRAVGDRRRAPAGLAVGVDLAGR